MKYTYILFILLYSCSITNLDGQKAETFSKEKNTQLFLQAFDKYVKNKTNEQEIDDAYHKFYSDIFPKTEHQSWIFCEEIAEIRLDTIFFLIKNKRMFKHIWRYEYSNKDSLNYLSPQLQGSYFKELELLGKTNELIKSYVLSTKLSGNVSLVYSRELIRQQSEFNFSNEENRLLFAILTITLSSQVELYKYK